ncbi:MAG: zinc dependent phospholipase C family protein [Desulfuromonadales bacterium]
MAFHIFVATAAFLLLPEKALAWGAGIHLEVGNFVLENMGRLPVALRTLLSAHPHDFLYGCISADITLGKKFTHYLQHCHSWRMGRKILDKSVTDQQKACALGYFCHLGADTVAHSYYVPFKMVRTFNTVLLKHTYWEMRYESMVRPQTWQKARELANKDFSENDRLMRSVLSETLFSFATNKRLFNSIMLVSRLEQWQKVLKSYSETSKWALEKDAREYLELAQQASLSTLADMEESPYLRADPTGERAINAAKMIRKNLNLLWLDGKLPEQEGIQIVRGFKKHFRESITRPDLLLEMLSEEV